MKSHVKEIFSDPTLHLGVVGFFSAMTMQGIIGILIGLLTIAAMLPVVITRWRKLLRGERVDSKSPFPSGPEAGVAPLVVVMVLAAVGVLGWIAKPKVFHGETRRAESAAEATKKVEDAANKQAAVAAASVVGIGRANSAAPASPAKDFISREVPVALANLPSPDAQALLEEERRRSAVMEGRAAEAESLYTAALERADVLGQEKAEAIRAADRANLELLTVAAEHRAEERQRDILIAVAVVCVVLYGYTKLTHVSPGALAEAVGDMKANVHPVHALDTVMTRTQQAFVRFIGKLKS